MKKKSFQRDIGKKPLLLILSIIIGLTLAEIILTLAHTVQHGWPRRYEFIESRSANVEHLFQPTTENERWDDTQLALHPFFGYTWNPSLEKVNSIGFRCKYDITLSKNGYELTGKDPENILCVGIFGGSFADFVARDGGTLEKSLKETFPDKVPIVLNFGCAGYALPQTAFIYLFYRDLFDVVVFIDGLNECWNYITNNNAGFPPQYAKASHYTYKLSREKLTPEIFENTASIISLQGKIEYITRLSLHPIIRRSILIHLKST